MGQAAVPARAEAGAGTKCRRGQVADWERDAGDQITWQAAGSERPGTGRDAGEDRGLGQGKMPAGAEAEQAAGLERTGTGRDTGGGRGLGQDKMPAGAKAWAGTRCRRKNHRAGSGLGAVRDRTGCRRDAGEGRG